MISNPILEIQTAYKVVQFDRFTNKLKSCNSSYAIEYELGKWITAEYGKLFVFNNVLDAQLCAHGCFQTMKVFCCETLELELCTSRILAIGDIFGDRSLFKTFMWEYWNNHYIDSCYLMEPPSGTMLCKSLRLIEEIKS